MGCGSSTPTEGQASPDQERKESKQEFGSMPLQSPSNEPETRDENSPPYFPEQEGGEEIEEGDKVSLIISESAAWQTPTSSKTSVALNSAENKSPRKSPQSSPRKAGGNPKRSKDKYHQEDEETSEERQETENNDRGFKKRVRQKLIDATKDGDIDELTKMIALFEKQKLEDCGDLKKAKDRLYFLKLKRDLRDSVRRRHAGVLDKTIEEARNSKYADKLHSQIENAEKLRTHLQELNRCSHDICKMEQSTISELRSYQRPPPCVHDVMAATYMLMGYPDHKLGDWSEIQSHLGQLTRDKLIRQVSEFDTKNVSDKTSSRVKDILNAYSIEEVKDASYGAATFYVWTDNMIDKIEKDKEGAERIEEQQQQQQQQQQQTPTKRKG